MPCEFSRPEGSGANSRHLACLEDWGDNIAVPGASGPGVQTSPSIALDAQDRLHVVWVERRADGAASRIRYTVVK